MEGKFLFATRLMLQLTKKEYQDFLRCQFGTLEMGKYSKYLPYAFTEQG
ncbi:MAG: ORF6N domain-containing protein, partial [Candidatus Omnitrophota bacterium]